MNGLPQLCILSPDSFYAAQLQEVEFPSFESLVFQSLEDLEQCPDRLTPSICLVFGSHFTRLSLAETLLFIRTRFRAAKIVQVEGVSEPALQQVWPTPIARDLTSKPVAFKDVRSLDTALQEICDGWEALVEVSGSLTASQLSVLAALAAGQTNREIAQSRGTTTRAVESLVNRTFIRVGLGEKANARTRSQKAQDYLSSLGTRPRISVLN
jgi:DNA-binding CsgD family transcriptional regulator